MSAWGPGIFVQRFGNFLSKIRNLEIFPQRSEIWEFPHRDQDQRSEIWKFPHSDRDPRTEIWKFPLRDWDHRTEIWKISLRDRDQRSEIWKFPFRDQDQRSEIKIIEQRFGNSPSEIEIIEQRFGKWCRKKMWQPPLKIFPNHCCINFENVLSHYEEKILNIQKNTSNLFLNIWGSWVMVEDEGSHFFRHPVVTPTFLNLSSIVNWTWNKLMVSSLTKQIKGKVPLPFFLLAATLFYFYMFFQHNFIFLAAKTGQ